MQISELNINLLKAFGGKSQVKSEENTETQFSDLLQIAQNDKNDAEISPIKVEKNRDIKVSTKEISSREIKPEDNRVSNPQDVSVNMEKNEAKTTQKTEAQTENKEDAVSTNKESVEKVSTKKEETQTTQNAVTDTVSETSVPTVEPIVVENIDDGALAMVVNVAVATPIIEQVVENISEDAVVDVVTEPENVIVTPENEQEVVPQVVQMEGTDDSKKDSNMVGVTPETVQNNEEITSENEVIHKERGKKAINNNQTKVENIATQDNEVIEVVDDTIRVQEEKIAEKLPEDTKVEIKVSVKNDAITTSDENKITIPEVSFEQENVKIENSSVEVLEQKPETVSVAKQDDNTQATPTVAVVENRFIRNEASSTAEQNEMTVATVTETPTAAVFADHVVAEHIRNHEVTDFKSLDNKNLTKDVAEQIKVNITQSAIKGVDKIEIQLKPADLGKIEIKMQIGRDGQLHAHITAANAETLEMLQKDISSLKDAFAGAGYLTDDGSFSFARQGEENNEREKMREFIGEIITHDVEEEMAANDYITADGVNIRV